MEPEWHTYWKNPGDSGLPTRLTWRTARGLRTRAASLPGARAASGGTPRELRTLRASPCTSSRSRRRLPSTPGTTVTFAARADWLECKEACVPGKAELALTLPVQVRDAAWTPGERGSLRRSRKRPSRGRERVADRAPGRSRWSSPPLPTAECRAVPSHVLPRAKGPRRPAGSADAAADRRASPDSTSSPPRLARVAGGLACGDDRSPGCRDARGTTGGRDVSARVVKTASILPPAAVVGGATPAGGPGLLLALVFALGGGTAPQPHALRVARALAQGAELRPARGRRCEEGLAPRRRLHGGRSRLLLGARRGAPRPPRRRARASGGGSSSSRPPSSWSSPCSSSCSA